MDKPALIAAIRTAVKASGGRRIGMQKFLVATPSVKSSDIYRHFTGWRPALHAAGIDPTARNSAIDPAILLTDWASIAESLGRFPTRHEYKNRGGKHCGDTFTRRFGAWSKIPDAFRAFAGKNPRWQPLLEKLAPFFHKRRFRHPPDPLYAPCKTAPRIPDRLACGDPLDFGPMRHAPATESGVIFLFALLAARLGFMIEGFQAAFPDCLAKRRVGPDAWQPVTIEFEYESRGFHFHRHPPGGCDIIVCWNHNWAECPKNLEVIALSEELKRLSASAAATGRGGRRPPLPFSSQPGGLPELDSWRGRGARAAISRG